MLNLNKGRKLGVSKLDFWIIQVNQCSGISPILQTETNNSYKQREIVSS